ncbi:MAG: PD-(D/E)XK nuclease domain-containing protein [Muribaculaceae bacterium]|nr:PD-(D/E)XK nuclease domain-containing protein [Muribaculaceae bacterium]
MNSLYLMIFKLTRLYRTSNSLEKSDVEGFVKLLKTFFANIPFDLRRNVEKYENYYHTIFYVILRLLGMNVAAEYHMSEGSIDIVIKTDRYIYVIELKINGSANDAMSQIEARNYYLPFVGDSRRIVKLGIGFAEATHTIDSYVIN